MTTCYEGAQLALDAIYRLPTTGIPSWFINVMEHASIERLAGEAGGRYTADHERVYLAMQHAVGTCALDQWIPDNPLSMGDQGYETDDKPVTGGAETIELDGVVIDSPESVVEHLERIVFPRWQHEIDHFSASAFVEGVLAYEQSVQKKLSPTILKVPYHTHIPRLFYGWYGYTNYFMAYALYPEVMERSFSLQADLAQLANRAIAQAIIDAKLPPAMRLDHDMADSRGTLVNIDSLDRIWFPHFARAIKPLVHAGINLLWHCDGNLMAMVPRLINAGIGGFQGFQYEDGMDYEKICRMKTRDGRNLLIVAGISVTRTLPFGSPDDVRHEMRWLVDNGPTTGLFLSASSSIAPGTPFANIQAMIDGFKYYRQHGRPHA